MNSVNVALGNRGMMEEAARQCTKDRKKWRALVHMLLNEFHMAIFDKPCSFRPPSCDLVVITWRGEGCHYIMNGINYKMGATNENQGVDVKYMGEGMYVDDCVCVI